MRRGEAAKLAATEHQGLTRSLGEMAEQAKRAGESLIAMWASNEMAKGAVDAYEETDHAIRQIAVAADISREAAEKLHKTLADLPASQVNATVGELDKLAVMGSKLQGTTEDIKKFAVAVGQISNQADFEAIGRGIEQILSASNEGAAGAVKLADALGTFGPKAREGTAGLTQMTAMLASFTAGMGISSEKLVAYAAAFDQIGGRPERQIMQFNMMLQNIEKQARGSGEGLRSLAERTNSTVDAMRKLAEQHPDEVYNKILQVVSQIKTQGGDPSVFLKNFGIQAGHEMQQVEALASKYKELQTALSTDTAGGAAKNQAKLYDDYSRAVTDLGKAWDSLKEEVGGDIVGPLTAAFKELTAVLQGAQIALHDMGSAGQVIAGLAVFAPGILGVANAFNLVRKALTGLGALAVAEGGGVAAGARVMGAGAAGGIAGSGALGGAMMTGAAMGFAGYESFRAGQAIGDTINQQKSFGKQGVTWGDEFAALNPFMSEDSFRKRMQSEKDAGQYRPGATESREEEQERKSQQDMSSETKRQGAFANLGAGAGQATFSKTDIDDMIAAYDEFGKKRKAIQDQEDEFNLKEAKMTQAQKDAYAPQIAQIDAMFEHRKKLAEPMAEENRALDDQIAKANAITKEQQNQLAIMLEIRKQQDSGAIAFGPAGDQARGDLAAKMHTAQGADRDKEFADQMRSMQQQLALAQALTTTEKDRLEVEQQIANAQMTKGYTDDELAKMKQVLELTKQANNEMAQFKSLNPQAAALRDYNDQLSILNQRLAEAKINQDEYNREKTKLDQSTLAARSPVGEIAQQQGDELAQLEINGKYREADLKTLQEITQLKREGVNLDSADGKAIADQLSSNNRMLQDIKDTQQELNSLTESFGSGLSQAIGSALNGQKYAFDKFFASMGQKMMDQAFTNIAKQLEPSVNGVLGGLFGQAQGGVGSLTSLAAKQAATTTAVASQTIGTATIQATNVTVIGGGAAGAASATNGITGTGAAAVSSVAGGVSSVSGVTSAAGTAVTDGGASIAAAAPAVAAAAAVLRSGRGMLPIGGSTGATSSVTDLSGASGWGSALGQVKSGFNPLTGGTFKMPSLMGASGAAAPASAASSGGLPPGLIEGVMAGGKAELPPNVTAALAARGYPSQTGSAANPWAGMSPDQIAKATGANTYETGLLPNNYQMTSADIGSHMSSNDALVAGLQKLGAGGAGGASSIAMGMPGRGMPAASPWGSLPDASVIGSPSIQMGALGRGLPSNPYGSLDPSQFNGGLNPFSNVKMAFNPAGAGVTTAAAAPAAAAGTPAGYPVGWNGIDSLQVANDRAFLMAHSSGSAATRASDFKDMNPDMVTKSAASIREADANGMNVSIFSGARPPNATGGVGSAGVFDMGGYSLHPVGMAADFSGIGRAGSAQSSQWNDIATKNGLFNPYGPDNLKEWNHYQDVPQRNLDRSGPTEKYYWDQNRSPDRDKAMWGDENKEFGLPSHGMDSGAASDLQKQAADALQNTTKTTTDSFKTLSSSLTDVGKTATGAVPDMSQFTSGIQSMMGKLSQSVSGGGGGGGGLGGLFGGGGGGFGGGIGDDMIGLGGLFHEGGSVGNDNVPSRAMPRIVFSRATRFHDGLGDDEFPAILQRGERVLTANQDMRATALMSRMADMVANQSTPAGTQNVGRGPTPHMTMIVNTPNASSFRYSQSQIMAQTQAAMQRIGKKHN